MYIKRIVLLFLAFFSVALWTNPATAAFSIEYQAPADPATQGFTPSVYYYPAPQVIEPIANDLGYPAWSISGLGLSSQFVYRTFALTDAQKADINSQGFTLTLRARVLQGIAPPYDVYNTTIGAVGLDILSRRYDLFLGIDSNGNTVAVLPTSIARSGPGESFQAYGASYTLNDTGYHAYDLVFNPSTQSASLFIDGVERISGYTGHNMFTFDNGFDFGATSGGGINVYFARLTSPAVQPPSFDPALDFSAINNPNGAWGYGYSTMSEWDIRLGPFMLYTNTGTTISGNPNFSYWGANIGADGTPGVYKNTSAANQQAGSLNLDPGQLALHPGPNGEVSVVRWTAPKAARISLNATFTGRDNVNGTLSHIYIFQNGRSLFDAIVDGFGPGSGTGTSLLPQALELSVQPGDTIDFAVGPYGSSINNWTGLDATIQVISDTTDTTPPELTLPSNITAEATSSSGAVVTYTVSAEDDVDGAVTPTCTPPSNSTFAIGTTTVNCTATDKAGNTGSGSFTVTVRDTTPPTITVPSNITAEATGPNGAVVDYPPASATDLVDSAVSVNCAPASRSMFSIGTTTVSCTATDTAGNTGSGSFTVTVRDTTPPVLSLPADITVAATDPSGAVVNYPPASATDLVDGTVTPTCTPPSDSMFPIGTTTVSCTATDKAGNATNGSFKVTVVGTTPPTTSAFSAFNVNPLRINQRLKTFFLLSAFTLGADSDGINPATKPTEPVTLTIANFTTTIPAGAFHKGYKGVYAFAGKINNVALEALIVPLGNNRFGFQAAAYGVNFSNTTNPVTVELMIGNDQGITSGNAIIK